MFTSNSYHKYIIAATALFILITGILIYIYPAAVFPDPSWGFQVLRGMRMGGHFNMLPSPDMTDLSKNNPSFLSWWSPGQYLVPYFFISLFKLNIGQANAVVVIICSLTGLAGLYACFKKIGFSANIAALSIAFIACQQAFIIPFVFYNGGEILLFAFAGWFLYGCIAFTKTNWAAMLFILASGIIGFFCKSAFVWIFFSGLFCLWLRLSSGKEIKQWLLNGISIGIPAVLSIAIIYATYLSKGDNPASDSQGLKLAWETFSFPLAAPLLAGLSVDDLTNGLVNHAGPAVFNPLWTIIVIVLLAIISLTLVIYLYRVIPYTNYKLLLAIFYTISVLFFGITFLRQANISYESRHLRIIGLIITPGIIYLITKLGTPYRLLVGLTWLFITYHSVKYLTAGYHRNRYYAAHGHTGIAQEFIDQGTLNYLHALDAQQNNAIFVFISPDLGLEIEHNRIITFDPVSDTLTADEDIYPYAGHAGPLYIVLPQNYAGKKANLYFSKFPGYHQFIPVKPGKGYLVYSAQ